MSSTHRVNRMGDATILSNEEDTNHNSYNKRKTEKDTAKTKPQISSAPSSNEPESDLIYIANSKARRA